MSRRREFLRVKALTRRQGPTLREGEVRAMDRFDELLTEIKPELAERETREEELMKTVTIMEAMVPFIRGPKAKKVQKQVLGAIRAFEREREI